MGLGIRGWRRVGLGLCKVGVVGSRSNSAPWILCSAVRTISKCGPDTAKLHNSQQLCDKTAHFRVAFYCGQPKAHLCNNHAV